MWKRAIAAIVGLLATASGVITCGLAIQALEDFSNPAVPFRIASLGTFFTWAVALGLLGLAFRFLRFALSGKAPLIDDSFRTLLLGAGCFFPGFVFSLPLTLFWAEHHWAGKAQSSLPAMEVSVYVGISAAVVGCIVLFKRRQSESSNNFHNAPLGWSKSSRCAASQDGCGHPSPRGL